MTARNERRWNDNHYGYPFKQLNGGRNEANKKYQGDCGPIALAIATGRTYDECTEALREDGGLTKRGGCFLERLVHTLAWEEKTFYGMVFERFSFPAVKGQVRMRPEAFCQKFSTGHYILQVSRHYISCVDGVIMSEYPVAPDRCIYAAYKIIKVQ